MTAKLSEAARAYAHDAARAVRAEIADSIPGIGQGIARFASEYDLRYSDAMQGARELMAHLYELAGVRACRVCGCTDEEGCDEGCSWAGPDLCSRCTPRRKRKKGRR